MVRGEAFAGTWQAHLGPGNVKTCNSRPRIESGSSVKAIFTAMNKLHPAKNASIPRASGIPGAYHARTKAQLTSNVAPRRRITLGPAVLLALGMSLALAFAARQPTGKRLIFYAAERGEFWPAQSAALILIKDPLALLGCALHPAQYIALEYPCS